MTEKRSYTWSQEHLDRKRLRDERIETTYAEIGEQMAQAVLEGGQTEQWVWELIKPLEVYEKWLIKKWLSRYRAQHRPRLRWRKELQRRKAQRSQELRKLKEGLRRSNPC